MYQLQQKGKQQLQQALQNELEVQLQHQQQSKHKQKQLQYKQLLQHQQQKTFYSKINNMLTSFFPDHNVRQLFIKQLMMIPQAHYFMSIHTTQNNQYPKIYVQIVQHPLGYTQSQILFQALQQDQDKNNKNQNQNQTKKKSQILKQDFRHMQEKIGKQNNEKGFLKKKLKTQIQTQISSNVSNQHQIQQDNVSSTIHHKNRKKSKHQLIRQGSLKKVTNVYAIRITKEFPIAGVRLYALSGDIQPQIFDTRDLMQDCLGQKWTYKNSLYQIYQNLYKVDQKLQMRSEKYLSIQKTGQFNLLDQFSMKELQTLFPSLNIFPNLPAKTSISSLNNQKDHQKNRRFSVICVSQTHLLVFKENVYEKKNSVNSMYGHYSPNSTSQGNNNSFSFSNASQNSKFNFISPSKKIHKQSQSYSPNKNNPSKFITYPFKKPKQKQNKKDNNDINHQQKNVFLSRCCDLQCISQINYSNNQIQLTVLKYRSFKSFNQYEPLTKRYVFEDGQYFLRTVLKNITKFQNIKIGFMPKELEMGIGNSNTNINTTSSTKISSNSSLSSSSSQQNTEESFLISRVKQTQDMQQRLTKVLSTKQKKVIVQRLHKSYQKLIEYYSARAAPYYLIYVNKLNNLYSKYSLNIEEDKNNHE